MDVIAVYSDPAFNYFFTIGVQWAFAMASGFAALSLFEARS